MQTAESHEAPGRDAPRSARGVRTRAALVTAARTVFERDGYVNARLSDITRKAKMSTGSFYTYFTNKEEIFAAVLEEVQEEMLHPHVRQVTDREDPVAVIEAGNRAYLEAYERNAKLMRLLDQVAAIDDDFRELRRRRSSLFAERNARSIRDLQARGLADPDVDPDIAALALGGMVGRAAQQVYVHGEEIDREALVRALTRLWANALRLDIAPTPARKASSKATAAKRRTR